MRATLEETAQADGASGTHEGKKAYLERFLVLGLSMYLAGRVFLGVLRNRARVCRSPLLVEKSGHYLLIEEPGTFWAAFREHRFHSYPGRSVRTSPPIVLAGAL